jgi:DNA-binding NarL/FixJ family response regulator
MKVKPTTQPIIGIAVIEDDPIRLVGLRSILDLVPSFHLFATSISDMAMVQRVDIVILRSSRNKFLQTLATLRVFRPDSRVLVTGTGADDETILKAIAAGMLGRERQAGSFRLTAREKQVLEMLVEGRSNKEIGNPLGIEERTVKAHVAKLMHKVGVKNRVALSVHAVRHSLVSASGLPR